MRPCSFLRRAAALAASLEIAVLLVPASATAQGSASEPEQSAAFFLSPHNEADLPGNFVPVLGDFDGDGQQDVFLLGSPDSWICSGHAPSCVQHNDRDWKTRFEGTSEDLDGDGKDELILAGATGSAVCGSPDFECEIDPEPADPQPARAAAANAEGRCARLLQADRKILFCEDFENPGFNRPGPLRAGHAWFDRFGSATPDQNCEGPGGNCAVDVVAAGQCNATGESGRSCIFDGNQSLGFPYRNGGSGGNLGEFRFSETERRSFGVTFALRMSATFTPTTPAKFNRLFGPQRDVDGTVHELLGVNTDEGYVGKNARGTVGGFFDVPRNTPFQAIWDQDGCSTANARDLKPCTNQSKAIVRVGQWGENDVHMVAQPLPDDASAYHFPDHAPGGGPVRGRWLCVQFHARDWGTSNARLRWWIDGVPVMDIDRLDMTRTRGEDKRGLLGLRFEHFVNRPYQGSAYRYEDNLVVTGADQPVSCSAIGFP